MKNRVGVIGITILIILAAFGIMYMVGANQPTIVSLFLGLVLARTIPWIINMGFESDITKIKNRIYRALHLKHANILGLPDSIEDEIMYYRTRIKLPFEDLLKKIDIEMNMLALSFSEITNTYIDDITKYAAGGKRFTFLVLDPKSKYVKTHSQRGTARNLKSQIKNSLLILWDLKTKYPDKITIKTYDDLAPLAVILIDDNMIKVEDRLVGRDAKNRPNSFAYKIGNPIFYEQYLDEYNRVLAIATDYHPT